MLAFIKRLGLQVQVNKFSCNGPPVASPFCVVARGRGPVEGHQRQRRLRRSMGRARAPHVLLELGARGGSAGLVLGGEVAARREAQVPLVRPGRSPNCFVWASKPVLKLNCFAAPEKTKVRYELVLCIEMQTPYPLPTKTKHLVLPGWVSVVFVASQLVPRGAPEFWSPGCGQPYSKSVGWRFTGKARPRECTWSA